MRFLALLLLATASWADTPGQVINKTCPAHQWYEAITPGHSPVCTQPAYSDLAGSFTGNAPTCSQFLFPPTQCASGQMATGVQVNGNANCAEVPEQGIISLTSAFPIVQTGPSTTPSLSLVGAPANTVYAGPTSGPSAAPSPRALVAADIPTVAGDVTGSIGATTVSKIQGASITGTTGTGNVVLSSSPQLSAGNVLINSGGSHHPGSNMDGNLLEINRAAGSACTTAGNTDSADTHTYTCGASSITTWGTVTDAGVKTEIFRMNPIGLGIFKIPAVPLDVNGEADISGALTAGGAVTLSNLTTAGTVRTDSSGHLSSQVTPTSVTGVYPVIVTSPSTTPVVSLPGFNANFVMAGPTTGPSAAPSPRALVAADINEALKTPGPIGSVTPNTGSFTAVMVDAGSNTAPSLVLGDNAGNNTGLYSSGASAIDFTVTGAKLAEINNSGMDVFKTITAHAGGFDDALQITNSSGSSVFAIFNDTGSLFAPSINWVAAPNSYGAATVQMVLPSPTPSPYAVALWSQPCPTASPYVTMSTSGSKGSLTCAGVTGTGSTVLASSPSIASPTLTGTTAAGALNAGEMSSTVSASGSYNSFSISNSNSGGFVRTSLLVGSGGANGEADIAYAPGIFLKMSAAANDTTTPLVFSNNNDTARMSIASTGEITLGTASSTPQHILNTATSTGAQLGTITNSPVAGNPTGYIQMTINGGTHYIPYW